MFKMAGKNVRKIIWGPDVKDTFESSDYAFYDSKSIFYMILPAMLDYWDSGMRNDR